MFGQESKCCDWFGFPWVSKGKQNFVSHMSQNVDIDFSCTRGNNFDLSMYVFTLLSHVVSVFIGLNENGIYWILFNI